jgi:hypothetical protein
MKLLMLLILIATALCTLIIQIANSHQLDQLQETVEQVYDNTCYVCSRRGIVDEMDS